MDRHRQVVVAVLRWHEKPVSYEFRGHELHRVGEALTLDRYRVRINRFSPVQVPRHVIRLFPMLLRWDTKRSEHASLELGDGVCASVAHPLDQMLLHLDQFAIAWLNCSDKSIKFCLPDDRR